MGKVGGWKREKVGSSLGTWEPHLQPWPVE